MSKTKEESAVAVVEQPRSLITAAKNDMVPDFMREEAPQGLEKLKRVVRPPRLKVVQGAKSDKYADAKSGQVLLTPTGVLLAEPDEPFYVVPLLHYPEWACVNPYEMRGTLNMIRERTMDISSAVAAKAMDPKRRSSEPCPEDNMYGQQNRNQYRLKYKEYLVFICYLLAKGDVPGQVILLSFSGGEYGTGQNFASAIINRQAHIYGCVFEVRSPSKVRSRNGYTWFGLDAMNPTSQGCPHPFVQVREDFEQFKKLHEQYAEVYLRGLDQVDLGEDDIADDAAAQSAVVASAESKF
jgi:hypothetical protein